MPIHSITQPAANTLKAAYAPIWFRVEASSSAGTSPVPPVVYCDIYINGLFYKSLSKTAYAALTLIGAQYDFDIADALQEYLGKYLPPNGGSEIAQPSNVIARVFCRFRSTGIDTDGFTVLEGAAPVQGTANTSPVGGGGTESNSFFVMNAALNHEQNQDLPTHLASYKNRNWNAAAYPATHRPARYYIGLNQSDFFPLLLSNSLCQSKIRVRFRYVGQSVFSQQESSVAQGACSSIVSNFTVNQVGFIIIPPTYRVAWQFTGTPSGFIHQLDGGTEILVTTPYVDFTGLASGAHTITVTPVCACTQGAPQTHNFTI